MQIELDVSKKYFLTIAVAMLLLTGAIAVISYGTSNPLSLGHSSGEIENISALFWVNHTLLASYNDLERPGCIPNSANQSSKYATSGTVAACNRFCSNGCSAAGGSCTAQLPGKGYSWGTFVECDTQQAQCLCIN